MVVYSEDGHSAQISSQTATQEVERGRETRSESDGEEDELMHEGKI